MSTNSIPQKQCNQCRIEKPVYEFHKHSRQKDGYRTICKMCRSKNEGHKYVKPAPPGYQWCRKCDTLYLATRENFYWNAVQSRLYSSCKACHYTRTRNWQKANYEFWSGLNRDWALRNPHKVTNTWKKWRAANPHKAKAIVKKAQAKYRITHPAERKAEKAKRRALELNAPGTHTAADIRLQITSQTDKKGHLRCWWCSDTIDGAYHVDHRVALARGGSNAPDNLVISCPVCNLSKSDKSPQEWTGRLL